MFLNCPYLACDKIGHFHGDLVRPWECHELVPPPLDYLSHIESCEEFNWHQVLKLVRIDADNLKGFPRLRVVPQNVPMNCFIYA